MTSWVRSHFEHLRRWREYTVAIARAVGDLVPNAEVYVIGGVAEDRTTVLSDVDVLIVLPSTTRIDKRRFYVEVMVRTMDVYEMPWDAPVELHVVGEDEARHYLGVTRRAIKVSAAHNP